MTTDGAAAAAATPAVVARDVVKRYGSGDSAVEALRGVSVEFPRGQFAAVMGTSGSGKSTMLNILGCLDVPTSGHYVLDGVAVETMTKPQLADLRNAKLGFVFQGFNLLARTSAVENVELPLLYAHHAKVAPADRRARALRALAAVGLADRAGHHPNQLSGGQQQRVAIARALLNDPAILLADEPTGNLDSRTSVEIMEIFQRLNAERGITIVLITHEPQVAEYGSRIIRFTDGRVVSDEVNTARAAATELAAAGREDVSSNRDRFQGNSR